MKKLVTGAVFATLMASSAFAQSYNPDYGSGNDVPKAQSADNAAGNSFAYARHQGMRAQASANSAAAYEYGKYVGTDPDANIRFQLLRDPPGRD